MADPIYNCQSLEVYLKAFEQQRPTVVASAILCVELDAVFVHLNGNDDCEDCYHWRYHRGCNYYHGAARMACHWNPLNQSVD